MATIIILHTTRWFSRWRHYLQYSLPTTQCFDDYVYIFAFRIDGVNPITSHDSSDMNINSRVVHNINVTINTHATHHNMMIQYTTLHVTPIKPHCPECCKMKTSANFLFGTPKTPKTRSGYRNVQKYAILLYYQNEHAFYLSTTHFIANIHQF